MLTLKDLRNIKSLDDLERADLPIPEFKVGWWRDYGRLYEPTDSRSLMGFAHDVLQRALGRLVEAKGSVTAEVEREVFDALAMAKALKRRADALRPGELEQQKSFDPRASYGQPGGYGADGFPFSGQSADLQRVDIGPAESVKSVLAQRGKLVTPPELAGATFGGVMRALITGPRTEYERKALAEGTDAAGGYTVPVFLLLEVIDAMRARTVTIKAGARTIPLDTQKTSIARVASDPVAGWRAENAAVAESDPTFEKVEFVARSLAVLVKASRELVEDSLNIETALRQAFAGAMAVEVDRVALLGTGTAPQPRGIANTSGVGSVSMGTNGAALTNYDKVLDALQVMADANAADPTAAIMAPRTLTTIAKLKDTTNQPLRRPVSLEALSFYQTTSMPVNETQGTANNASRIILGNFAELLIGVRTAMRVEVLRETFAGNLQYGFLAHLRADIALTHPASFAQVVGIIP